MIVMKLKFLLLICLLFIASFSASTFACKPSWSENLQVQNAYDVNESNIFFITQDSRLKNMILFNYAIKEYFIVDGVPKTIKILIDGDELFYSNLTALELNQTSQIPYYLESFNESNIYVLPLLEISKKIKNLNNDLKQYNGTYFTILLDDVVVKNYVLDYQPARNNPCPSYDGNPVKNYASVLGVNYNIVIGVSLLLFIGVIFGIYKLRK